VTTFCQQHGDPDVKVILKRFPTAPADALRWESDLISAFSLHTNSKFLNKTDNKAIPPLHSLPINVQQERSRKISQAQRGRTYNTWTMSTEGKSKISNGQKSYWQTVTTDTRLERGEQMAIGKQQAKANKSPRYRTPYGDLVSGIDGAALAKISTTTFYNRCNSLSFPDYYKL
jgi:hypothetical protein